MSDLLLRSRPFTKTTNGLQLFDGSAASEALYFTPGEPISGLKVFLGANIATAGMVSTLWTLEYFSGATWNGSAWAGGAWT